MKKVDRWLIIAELRLKTLICGLECEPMGQNGPCQSTQIGPEWEYGPGNAQQEALRIV